MSVGYNLVNHTRREWIIWAHLPVSTRSELITNPVSGAITVWYLLHHPGDRIAFVSDSLGDWPFPDGSPDELATYREITDELVRKLCDEGFLRDDGMEWVDEDEPDRVYIRAIRACPE
jgi:hypothetical protein